MILCIDAGNTRVKFGLLGPRGWTWRDALPCAELEGRLDGLVARLPESPDRILACSVASARLNAALETIATRFGIQLQWLRSTADEYGVRNGYATPQQLGNDRWAALIGARQLCQCACVVVMAGTATTVDSLDGAGRFMGGMILPGLTLMRASLARDTAQLPLAQGHYQDWPTNTDDAIVSGSIVATAGAVKWAREKLSTTIGGQVPCVLSGGAAPELERFVGAPLIVQPDLVLEGLAHAAGNQREGSQG